MSKPPKVGDKCYFTYWDYTKGAKPVIGFGSREVLKVFKTWCVIGGGVYRSRRRKISELCFSKKAAIAAALSSARADLKSWQVACSRNTKDCKARIAAAEKGLLAEVRRK